MWRQILECLCGPFEVVTLPNNSKACLHSLATHPGCQAPADLRDLELRKSW